MDFLNKIANVMGFLDKEDDDEPIKERALEPVRNDMKPLKKANNLVSIPTQPAREITVINNVNSQSAKVVLQEPTGFEEAQSIADHLLNKRAVIINIESCDPEIATKLIDFVGGVVYAIDGTIQKVSQGIVLAAPANIDIDSELKKQLQDDSTEVFSWVTKYNRREDF